MTPEIIQLVEVWGDDGGPLEDLCVKFYFTEKDLYMSADKFQALLVGTKTTRVRREVSETIGGPGYSSIKVSTSIEVACDQSEALIKKAADAILQECFLLNEDGVMKAFEGLKMHRKALKLEGA